jgi:hypothetical protein
VPGIVEENVNEMGGTRARPLEDEIQTEFTGHFPSRKNKLNIQAVSQKDYFENSYRNYCLSQFKLLL